VFAGFYYSIAKKCICARLLFDKNAAKQVFFVSAFKNREAKVENKRKISPFVLPKSVVSIIEIDQMAVSAGIPVGVIAVQFGTPKWDR
jgi:hypothetical protein